MKYTFQSFVKKAKQFSLEKAEKERIREMVLLYARSNPIPNGKRYWVSNAIYSTKVSYRPFSGKNISTDNNNKLTINKLKLMPIAALLIALLVGGAGTSFAAERALPGDLLFPIKVHATENIQSILSFTADSKARFEVERADRRLQELEQLVSKNRLTKDTLESQQNLLEDHTSKVLDLASRVKDDKSVIEIHSDLETTLKIHGAVIQKIRSGGSAQELEIEIEDLVSRMRSRADEVSQSRISTTFKVLGASEADLTAAANATLNSSENKLAEVKRFIARKQSGVSESVLAEANGFLQDAEKAIESGKQSLAANKSADAFIAFHNSRRLAQTAKKLVQAGVEIKTFANIDGVADLRQVVGLSEADATDFRLRLRALLAGSGGSGKADFEKRSDRTRLNVEVENTNLPLGTRLNVIVSGVNVGTLVIARDEANEDGDLNLDSRDGVSVPDLKIGDTVRIEGSGFVLTGSFQIKDLVEDNDDEFRIEVEIEDGDDDSDSRDGSSDDSSNDIRGNSDENELRGRDNEPGEDIRGNSDENELRGRDNEPGEDIQGNSDETELRGRENEVEIHSSQSGQSSTDDSGNDSNDDNSGGGGSSGSGKSED